MLRKCVFKLRRRILPLFVAISEVEAEADEDGVADEVVSAVAVLARGKSGLRRRQAAREGVGRSVAELAGDIEAIFPPVAADA